MTPDTKGPQEEEEGASKGAAGARDEEGAGGTENKEGVDRGGNPGAEETTTDEHNADAPHPSAAEKEPREGVRGADEGEGKDGTGGGGAGG